MALGDDLLMASLVGALEPGDAMALEDLVSQDVNVGIRRGGLGFLAEVDPGPAPDLGLEPSAPILGVEAGYRPGERLAIPLPEGLPADSLKAAIFHQFQGEWSLVFPTPGGDWPTLAIFRSLGDSSVIDLAVPGPPGAHVYVIALVPAEHFQVPWHSGHGDWTKLREAVAAGTIGGDIIHLEVVA